MYGAPRLEGAMNEPSTNWDLAHSLMDQARLTREQLKEITGCRQVKGIIKWLQANAFVFRLDSNGWPIVHPSHYAERLGVRKTVKEAREERERPESKRKFEAALEEMRRRAEERQRFLVERRKVKAEREAREAEEKRKRAEERQRHREEKERQVAEKAAAKAASAATPRG
jgi:hypothetical protein